MRQFTIMNYKRIDYPLWTNKVDFISFFERQHEFFSTEHKILFIAAAAVALSAVFRESLHHWVVICSIIFEQKMNETNKMEK